MKDYIKTMKRMASTTTEAAAITAVETRIKLHPEENLAFAVSQVKKFETGEAKDFLDKVLFALQFAGEICASY